MFSLINICKTNFLIEVFREHFNSLFKQKKALCRQDDAVFSTVLDVCTARNDSIRFDQDDAVFNQDQDVCTVHRRNSRQRCVHRRDLILHSIQTAPTVMFDSAFNQDEAVFDQDQDVCTDGVFRGWGLDWGRGWVCTRIDRNPSSWNYVILIQINGVLENDRNK